MLLNRPLKVPVDVLPSASYDPVAIVRAGFSVNTAKASGASAITFDSSIYDNGWGWTAGTQFTVPAGVDLVACSFIFERTGANLLDDRIDIQKNSTTILARQCDNAYWGNAFQRTLIPVTAGDVLRWYMGAQFAFTFSASRSYASFVGYSVS